MGRRYQLLLLACDKWKRCGSAMLLKEGSRGDFFTAKTAIIAANNDVDNWKEEMHHRSQNVRDQSGQEVATSFTR